MALTPGTRLGVYEVIAAIGEGGMGQVYRARDTRLDRDIAVKILPDAFAADPDRLARFEREAKTLASLNHPHIAAIYGFEKSAGLQALVMELVDGEDLSQRLARGAIPVDEALPIAQQIAEALEAAHAQGIIHRDLKPANIKVRTDGRVKVLDFGLAKAIDGAGGSGPDGSAGLSMSPTMASPARTMAGVILGTATYMSPEQARGKAVDARTDVWAFGCVLFEMLTGKQAFEGETITDVVAAIVKNDPDWRALPAQTPAGVRTLLARCLRKDPAQRLHHIADARFQIEDALIDAPAPVAAPVARRNGRHGWMAWMAAAALAASTIVLLLRPRTEPVTAEPISFPVFAPAGTAFTAAVNSTVNVPSFALSPDGHMLVFSAQTPGGRPTLWLRSMDRVDARELAGTDDGQDPFWSPDSQWIGFLSAGKLKKISAAGGAVQVIAQTATDFRGATWAADGTILFSSGIEPIVAVSAGGGSTPKPVTVVDTSHGENLNRYPLFLPGGDRFVYLGVGRPEVTGIYVGSRDGQTKKFLARGMASAAYAQPGWLLYVDGDTLLAQGFDADRLELKGQPVLVAPHVGRSSGHVSAVSASNRDVIAYGGTLSQPGQLTWRDRSGTSLGTVGPVGDYPDFRLSPDERRLAASLLDTRTNLIEIWLTDLARNSTSLLTAGGLITASALWSPDGAMLTFRTNRLGIMEFLQRSTAGGGEDRPLLSLASYEAAQIHSVNLAPTDWSLDGRTVLFSAPAAQSGNDLWLLPTTGPATPQHYVASPGQDLHGNFSPDGKLVAYTSNESGTFEIYVETLPRSDRKWSVSAGGGYEPRWRSDGREIYYLSSDRQLMAVPVSPGPSFGIPRALFQTHVPPGVIATRTHYVPSRDGQRFLVNTAVESPAPSITVVRNWTAALKK